MPPDHKLLDVRKYGETLVAIMTQTDASGPAKIVTQVIPQKTIKFVPPVCFKETPTSYQKPDQPRPAPDYEKTNTTICIPQEHRKSTPFYQLVNSDRSAIVDKPWSSTNNSQLTTSYT